MIQSHWKRVFALLLSLALLPMLAATVAAEETRPTLTVFIEEHPLVEDFETNTATKYIEDKIGVNLDFIVAPVGSAQEKMNILLNSGNYPDIFYVSVPNENLYGVESGILLDLTELIETEMPYFQEVLRLRPLIYDQLKAVDGKIYSFPTYSECYHCQYPQKMWYNSMQLESLGLEAPTTIDAFYEALKLYKESNPDGIPLAGVFGNRSADPTYFITSAYTYFPLGTGGEKMGLRLHDGTVETMINSEAYREALRFMNKLYTEGLLYEGSFTMDDNQMKALLASEGEPVLFWAAMHNVVYINGVDTPELYAHNEGLEPLIGPDGAQYAPYQVPSAVPAMSISVTCAYPELAAQLADLHYSIEGLRTIASGEENVNWRYGEEGEYTLLGNPLASMRITEYDTSVQNYKWEPRMIGLDIDEIVGIPDIGEFDWDDPVNGIYVRYKGTQLQYAPHYQEEYRTIPPLKFQSEEEEDLALLTVSLESYLSQAKVSFITGESSLDADWDAYVQTIQAMGMDEVIEYYQTAYDRL